MFSIEYGVAKIAFFWQNTKAFEIFFEIFLCYLLYLL